MTKQAFENAITVVMALGGSTNAVLHLLAMAHSVDVPLSIDDFQTISDRTPFIADLKPSGKYVMEDIHKVTIPIITIVITVIIIIIFIILILAIMMIMMIIITITIIPTIILII